MAIMPQTLHIWPEPDSDAEGQRTWRAVAEMPDGHRHPLWYRMPIEQAPIRVTSLDTFLLTALFPAMERADRLWIHGTASPSLLIHLMEAQAAWHRWRPDRYHVVDIQSDHVEESPLPDEKPAVLAFSGGLDSSFTAWDLGSRGAKEAPRTVGAALMVHGFDIPVSDIEVFARAAERSRRMLAPLGIPLLTMATNFRADRGPWEDRHGAALAAALHLVKDAFGSGVVASSHTFEHLRFPWGSNPITDPLFGSRRFPIRHHGCSHSRDEKAVAVAGWAEAMTDLRVCWAGAEKDRNCGVCLRCVGTAICFAAHGLPIPRAIAITDLGAVIRSLPAEELPSIAGERLAELLAVARHQGCQAGWVDELDALIGSINEPRGVLHRLNLRVRKRIRRWLSLIGRHMHRSR